MKRRALVLALTFVSGLVAQQSAAEVCVVVDADNVFERLQVETRPRAGIIWAKLSADIPDEWCVNLFGDTGGVAPTRSAGRSTRSGAPGDGAPANAVWVPDLLWDGGGADRQMEPLAPRAARSASSGSVSSSGLGAVPVVAWSRFDGQDWEILYAFWNHRIGLWSEPAFVDMIPNDVNDINPELHVDGQQLVLIWERVGEGDMETRGRLVMDASFFDVLWGTPGHLGTRGR